MQLTTLHSCAIARAYDSACSCMQAMVVCYAYFYVCLCVFMQGGQVDIYLIKDVHHVSYFIIAYL